jgi:hypothetical protein
MLFSRVVDASQERMLPVFEARFLAQYKAYRLRFHSDIALEYAVRSSL